MPIQSEAIPVLGSVGTSLMNGISNALSMSSQRDFDREMLREAREYNKPVNQVRRLREAGINPALALTNGMITSGTMDQTAGGQTPMKYDFSPIQQGMRDSVDLFLQRRFQDAQISNLKEQTINQSIRNKYENQRQLAELAESLSRKDLNEETKNHIRTMIDGLQKENAWIDKRNSAAIAKNDAEARLANEKATTENVMRDVNKRLVESGIRLNSAQQSLLNEQAKSVVESVNQMVLNGASQRQINSFIADKERETSNLLFKQNQTYQQEFESKIGLQEAETKKANREHVRNTFTFFGVPLGTRESIQDWKNGKPYGLEW